MSDELIDGLRYHVVEAGRGAPLVLLHGFTGSAAGWGPLLAHLAERYRVLAVDLPGHGGSDAPADAARYAMPRVAADLAEVLARRGVAAARCLGYSMGGRLALYVAATRPALVRTLILESASPGLATAGERRARRAADAVLADRIERDGIAAFVAEWERLPLFAGLARLPEATRDALHQQRLANDPTGLANSLRGMGTGAQPSLWAALGRVGAPSLLLAGEMDDKFVAINRRMAAAMANARLQIVAGAGHTVHLERPEAFREAVAGFLSSPLENDGQHLARGQQNREGQRRQRHLPEPGVEVG